MKPLTLALDWTANINHIGFFVAQEKGFYEDLDLELTLIDPLADQYQTTPAKKVERGTADFALCPTESIISYRTKKQPFDLIAIAGILQEDLSAIAVREHAGILSPKDLDGKTYSSYQARYEDGIVQEMIKNDGGQGDLTIIYPKKLGIWNTLLRGEADATWIFLNWEALDTKVATQALQYFKMRDYGIPYSYSPVIAASETKVATHKEVYQAFLTATKKGYLYSQQFPAEAVSILQKYVPETDQHIDLSKALAITAPHFGDADNWGRLKPEVIQHFVDWICERGLEREPVPVEQIATGR